MSRRKSKKSIPIKRLIMALVLVALIVLGVWAYHRHHTKPKITTTSTGAYVNLSPPTKQDQANNDALKRSPAQSPSSNSNSSSVSPIITSTSSTLIKAFVEGVVEDGGTCTAKLTRGSTTVTATSTGFANSSYTSCEPIKLNPPLTSGSWTATVSYSSSKASGTSTAQTFEVQ